MLIAPEPVDAVEPAGTGGVTEDGRDQLAPVALEDGVAVSLVVTRRECEGAD